MSSKRVSVILFFALILGILVSHGANYENSSVAFAASSGAQPVAQVPINITNTQSVAIPSPFQLMIQINSTEYAGYEAADLSNVAFTYSNNTIIPSWLESGNSNSSTDTVYWLKIGNIPARSSMTAFMDFYPVTDNVLNNMTTGEAPILSPLYGQYDDGPNVFIAYGDFNNSLSGWQASVYYGSFSPVATSNGVEMLNGGGGEGTYLILPTTLPSIPIQVEEAWDYYGDGYGNAISVGLSPFTTTNTVKYPGGASATVLNNSISAIFCYYYGATYLENYISQTQISSSSFSAGGNFHILSYLALNGTWASTGFLTQDVSLENFGSTPISATANGHAQTAFSSVALLIGAACGSGGGYTSSQYVRWVVARAFPPNGVAPSVTVGKVKAVSGVVPEFPSFLVLPLFMIAMLVAALVFKKKRNESL
jgi:hypothetical protein